ncbi:MAG: sigma-54-dependent Fis family transcriptional regulator [Phycisphaerales bacterium]|nr:sigma-54-dependent Fis family transcriptional regulator [Phycisphaerales bacterium]
MHSPQSPAKFQGSSRAVRQVLDLCARVAPTRSTVLITGETGTGKEIVARMIHRASPRRDKPMVVFDCHGVPETLLESELFGFERGAFTGAIQSRSGLFERANGGTLLLDEVGEIPLAAQAKLLRILQERRFQRLGGTATFESDVRIVATTHHDLRLLVQQGRFREDLFYRLNVFPIHVPPLRERREDSAGLTVTLLEAAARANRSRQSGFTETAVALLISYHWPGNTRQLQSVIERALLLSGGEPISEKHLPPEIVAGFLPPAAGETPTSLSYAQRLLIARALHETHWNWAKAAAQLGVSVHMLRQLAATLQIHREEQG